MIMSVIARNLQAVHARIAAATTVSRHPREIALPAASKPFGVDAALEAAHGQLTFGKCYFDQAMDKLATVRATAPQQLLEWHFIGQTPGTKKRFSPTY
ncbi:hypothetical protein BH11PSE11_BH11PSE11_25350 [soil metagenome]